MGDCSGIEVASRTTGEKARLWALACIFCFFVFLAYVACGLERSIASFTLSNI